LGLNPERKKASTFDNNYKYGEMLVEKTLSSIRLAASFITNYRKSSCSYISNGRKIGLSNE
jgi:GTP cyclohydrolase I